MTSKDKIQNPGSLTVDDEFTEYIVTYEIQQYNQVLGIFTDEWKWKKDCLPLNEETAEAAYNLLCYQCSNGDLPHIRNIRLVMRKIKVLK